MQSVGDILNKMLEKTAEQKKSVSNTAHIINGIVAVGLFIALIMSMASNAFASQYDPAFPDVILCEYTYGVDPVDGHMLMVYGLHDEAGNGWGLGAHTRVYMSPSPNATQSYIVFNADGTFNYTGSGSEFVGLNCDGKSISQLYTDAQAYDFTNATSSGGGSSTSTTNIIYASSTPETTMLALNSIVFGTVVTFFLGLGTSLWIYQRFSA